MANPADQGGGVVPDVSSDTIPAGTITSNQLTAEAESWIGYALAAVFLVVLAFIAAPALVVPAIIILVIASLQAVAKTGTAIVDFVTGGLGTDATSGRPLPPIVVMWNRLKWLLWMLIIGAALLWYFGKKRRTSK